MTKVVQPYPVFLDKDGTPLEDGYVYIGTPGFNAETSPVPIYWDAGLTILAGQPLRTINGQIARSGSAASVYVGGAYSIIVRDKNRALVSQELNVLDEASSLGAALAAPGGSALVGFLQAGMGAVARTVQDKERESFSILDVPASGGDDTSRLQTAMTIARASGKTVVFPASAPTMNVSSTIDVSGVHIVAYGRDKIHIQASSAQFDVLTTTGNTTITGLYIHGGWDGSTAGQSGDALVIKATSPAYPYTVHLRDMIIRFAKKRGIYWERGGYSSAFALDIRACGLHALECYAPSGADSMTTVTFNGCVFSDCPNGYGVKITNCISMAFIGGCISEYTGGIQLNGNDNRALSFSDFYQENTAKFIVDNSSAGIGLSIRNLYGAGVTMDPLTNWVNVYDLGGHAAITIPALSTQGRRVSGDSGQLTTSTTGGVNVTVTSISVPPGSWRIDATMQTLDASGSTLVGVGCRITPTAGATGYANDTSSNFVPGADAYRNTPVGGQSDARLNCWWYYDNTGTTNVTIYLRAFINISAGTLAYRGLLTASKVV